MRRALVVASILLAGTPLLAQSADAVWESLQNGNKQFVAGRLAYEKLADERTHLHDHQNPPTTILSCSDSRVPPELVFNQSLGSLFIIRAAGNIADTYGLASIEYAIAQGYTKLIVILGHESCGAVKASLGAADPDSPHLLALVQRIRASFVGLKWDEKDPSAVRKAIEANTKASAASLLAQSRIIRDAALAGKVKIVAAYYDLDTGEVVRLD